MRRQFVLPMALLIIALAVPSNAQNADVSVDEGAPLTVECVLRVEERAEWKLDGDAPPADLRPAGEAAAAGRLTARLHAAAARAAHAGVYTCARPPGQRVRVHVRAAAPSARAVPGEAAAPAPGSEPKLKQELYVVGTFHTFNCSVPRAGDAGSYVWRKNGTLVEDLPELRGRYKLDNADFKFTARTHEDDFGNYSCAIGGAAPALVVQLHGRPQAKLPANSHVVEGQNLRLVCKVVGKPYPAVKWLVRNESDEGANLTDVTAVLGERVELKDSDQGVLGAVLLLTAAQRADAGVYTCQPGSGGAAETVLRVKDMYAALWPFLGICAEVFVLCAIILVYEKRRTKPELDDSDTDNHEQKKS